MALLALWGADAQAAITGLERVAPNTASNSTDKGITATCPAGKKLIGPGVDVTPGAGHVLIDDIRPSADLQSLFVRAREDETGTTANWYLQAFAICASAPPGLERKALTSASNSSNKTVTVNCSAGKNLLGLAGEINSPNGQVLLEDLTPVAGLASATVKAVEDENGNSGNWSLTAYAICANPIAGLVRVSNTSANDSSNPKLFNASCPAGKQVVGTGGNINTPNGQIVLDAVFPDQTLTTAGIGAWEDDTGNTANWSLTAFAICANSAERTEAHGSSATFSDGEARAQTGCGIPGRQVTGSGADITGGHGEVAIHRIIPQLSPDPAGVTAQGFMDDDGINGVFVVSAYSICATPLPGLALVSAASASDSSDKSVIANCPSGTKVVGLGGNVDNGFTVVFSGPVAFGEVVMDGLTPNAALTSVTVRAFEDDDGFADNWTLTAYAICANPPPGLQLVTATSLLESDELARATANCPAGKNLLGTGGELAGGQGEVVIDDLRPNAALTSATVTGLEDENGYSSNWQAKAFAICANP
jgi:hypothetical protein